MKNKKLLAIAGLVCIVLALLVVAGLTGCGNAATTSESDELTKRVDQLTAENDRLKTVYEIQNLMGRYQYYISASEGAKIVELFAQKTPGVSGQIGDWGVYKGIDGIKILFPVSPEKRSAGSLSEHYLCNQVIEVAGDGKTAAGRWMSPGFETFKDPVTGKAQTLWNYNQYACDFVKEDGVWKIWHYSCMLDFTGSYADGWVNGGDLPKELKDEIRKTIPTTDGPYTYPDYMPYDPNAINKMAPAPTPYETYNPAVDWVAP